MIVVVLLSLVGFVTCIFVCVDKCHEYVLQNPIRIKKERKNTTAESQLLFQVTEEDVNSFQQSSPKKKRRHAKKKSERRKCANLQASNSSNVPTATKTLEYTGKQTLSRSARYDSSKLEDEPVVLKPKGILGGSGATIQIKGFTCDDADIISGAEADVIQQEESELAQLEDDAFVTEENVLTAVMDYIDDDE